MLPPDKKKLLELKFYEKVVDSNEEITFFKSHFTFLGVIGEGAFGLVVAARWNTKQNQAIAVKCFCKEDYEDSYIDLFRKEGKLTHRVEHPKLMRNLGVESIH
jgi:serine/threonine protein kinase